MPMVTISVDAAMSVAYCQASLGEKGEAKHLERLIGHSYRGPKMAQRSGDNTIHCRGEQRQLFKQCPAWKWLSQPWRAQPGTFSGGHTHCGFWGLAKTTNFLTSRSVFWQLLWFHKLCAWFSSLPSNCGTGGWWVVLQFMSATVSHYYCLERKTETANTTLISLSHTSLLPTTLHLDSIRSRTGCYLISVQKLHSAWDIFIHLNWNDQ